MTAQWTLPLLVLLAAVVAPHAAVGGDEDDGRRLAQQARQRLEEGRYAEAVDLGNQALALRERTFGADHAETAESLHDVAEAYRALGDFSRALPLAKRALDIRTRVLGADNPVTATSLNDLGLLYFEMGDCRSASDCREALPLIERALRIRKKALDPSHPDLGESLNNLGVLYRADKRYPDALPLFEQALVVKENALDPADPKIATAHINLAALYLQWADETVEPAETERLRLAGVDHLHAAKVILQKPGAQHTPAEKLLAARTLTTLARFFWKMGAVAHNQARELLRDALRIRVEALGEYHPDTAQSRNLLAAFYQSSHGHAEALTVYREGLAVEDAVLVNVLFGTASDEQKLQFLRKSQWHYFAALSLIQRHFRDDAAAVRFGFELVLRRKSIVLDAQSRMQEAVMQSLSGETLDSWNRLARYRTELSRLLLSGPGDHTSATWHQQIVTQQRAAAKEEAFLTERSARAGRELGQQRVAVEELAKALAAKTVLVEFVRIRDWNEEQAAWAQTFRYLAFVLTRDARVKLIDLGDAGEIDTAVDDTRERINDTKLFTSDLNAYTRSTDEKLADLYNRVLLPVDTVAGGSSRLVISPDGNLNRVPFDALRTAEGRYLLEERAVSYVTSGRDVVPSRSGAAAPAVKLLLIASPAFDDKDAVQTVASGTRAMRPPFRQQFGPLPGTQQEAQLIPPLVAGERRVLLGRDATEAALREAAAPQVLHFATHGFFLAAEALREMLGAASAGGEERAATRGEGDDPAALANPMIFSGLALAGANHASLVTQGYDGILTALEVSGMNLYGTNLVVLSACETALGQVEIGEGIYGLRRAFVLAGSKNLVMSLWPVDDETTRDLMVSFYRAYASGVPVGEALHQAQVETLASLRQKYQLTPVYLWAPFIAQQAG